MQINQIRERATALVQRYPKDMEDELIDVFESLKSIYLTEEKTLFYSIISKLKI